MIAQLLAVTILAGAAFPSAVPAQAAAEPASDSLAPLMERGISGDLAAYRARQIRDVRYALRLDVTARDSAVGHVVIHFRKVGAGDVILDWRGRSLGALVVNGRAPADSGDSIVANGAHIRLPEHALVMGENSVEASFVAAIAPAGASIIRYHDSTDGSDYLYTLLVPADANALFPCFDQPDLKARVSLTLVTPRGWSAVANGVLERTDSLGADTTAAESSSTDSAGARSDAVPITWRFAATRPLSTYLIAFAAGPWAQFHSAEGTRPITLYVRRSRAHEVDADTLLALNARALDWLERYFARPYPFGKFDFVLAPAFPFGGMEHPGAVFYNEDSFIFRERPTLNQELGREAAIFHEVAHQWFGDLVTMKWFDDLWLKEGFATYMAAKMQAALDPRSNAWKTFYLRIKPPAYAVDASAGTTPVWQELSNLDQAKSNYGAIVYDKAPSILKQLEYLVGERAFQAGLRAFLREHAYANATWRDLLRAVGRAAGRNLDDFGKQYILRPGMPVFEEHLEIDDARIARLDLIQHPAQPDVSGPGAWPARLLVVLWYSDAPLASVPVTVTSDSTRVPVTGKAAPGFVFANGSDYGYGLVMLDDRSVAWLERHIETVDDTFLRAMLWGALWDLVRDARLRPDAYVRLVLRSLPRERDEQIVSGILGRVARATNAYLPDSLRRALLPEVETSLARLANDSTRRYGLRKAGLDALIAVTATPGGLARLDSMLDGDSAAGAPLRSPTRWAIVTTLVAHGARGAEKRLAGETRRDSTSEGRRRAFVAGAARASAAAKREYWTRWFRDTTLNEEWVMASLRAFNEPSQDSLTLRYIIPALDSLPWIQRNRRIFFLGNWLGAFLDGQHSSTALEEVDGFLSAHEDWPADLREKILQAADELRRTVKIREELESAPRD